MLKKSVLVLLLVLLLPALSFSGVYAEEPKPPAPPTMAEIVQALNLIYQDLQGAHQAFQSMSMELYNTRTLLSTMQQQDLPILNRQLTDLEISFQGYKQVAENRIKLLTYATIGSIGVAIASIIIALIT